MDERLKRLGHLRGNSRILLPLLVIIAYALVGVVGPILLPYQSVNFDIANRLLPPFSTMQDGTIALLGTDNVGHDLLTEIIQGARISIEVGLATLTLAGVIGVVTGIAAGYFGGWVDVVLMRIADIQLAFPAILLAIYIAGIFGAGIFNVIAVLTIANWVGFARVMRAQTIATLPNEFVRASRAMGGSDWHIIRHCILPACIAPLIVIATVELGAVIVSEASLSFLGLGAPATTPSWGLIISNGRDYLSSAWWIATLPGFTLGILVIAVGILGDAVRDRLDTHLVVE